jgi:hypothetical protein
MQVKAQITIPRAANSRGKPTVFNTIGQRVIAYSIDSAMDTDTDSWTIQFGIEDAVGFAQDVLDRDAEVRANIYGFGNGAIETLHSGFADEITLDEQGTMSIQGRDITAVAVDSQHPPQIWHGIRPHVLVAQEARSLNIGDKLKLTKAAPFKTYATDGSESYWQVWYRFYRKRRMWMWAQPDATINAMTLHYNQPISYYFGRPGRPTGVRAANFIPVQTVEWRSNKQQRVGEVFYFGHRGDIGFLGQAHDPSTRKWIKRPNLIIASGDAHNQAEAHVEAWEEIFETKVGAVEIKLTIANPGFLIKQDRMAFVNLPHIGLVGEYYVVGAQILGSTSDGFYEIVRLREKNYAISARVPSDPRLKSLGPTSREGGAYGIASDLNTEGPADWNQYFVNAANKFHGPWDFKLYLGVLLSICEHETHFHNYRRGGSIEYPGTANGVPPAENDPEVRGVWHNFALNFANEAAKGIVNEDYAVGPMQLLTLGYKLYADRLGGANISDELMGGRWDPESNIMAGGAALATHLGAGWTISPSGHLSKSKITGLSLQPTEENIWQGVEGYGGSRKYMLEIRAIYNQTYKAVVEEAIATADAQGNAVAAEIPGTSEELRKRVINNDLITFERRASIEDIRSGQIDDEVLRFLLWFTDAMWPVTISVLKTGHSVHTSEGKISAHSVGKAVDMSNYNFTNLRTDAAMKFIAAGQAITKFSQLIGPNPQLVIPLGYYDDKTLNEHKSHIHVGWPI